MEPVCAGLSSQMLQTRFSFSRGDSECSGIARWSSQQIEDTSALLMSESYARRKPRAVRGLDDHTDLENYRSGPMFPV